MKMIKIITVKADEQHTVPPKRGEATSNSQCMVAKAILDSLGNQEEWESKNPGIPMVSIGVWSATVCGVDQMLPKFVANNIGSWIDGEKVEPFNFPLAVPAELS